MVSARILLTLAASAALYRIATGAAIPTDDEVSNSTSLLGSRTVDDETSIDKRGGPPLATPTIYSQYQVDHLDPSFGPLPNGVSGIPDGLRDGSGAVLCLCNDENYKNCMCIQDMEQQGWNTCFSNRGSSGQWSGFSNDAISSLTISGNRADPMACKFYADGNCEGQPFLVGSAATSYFLNPQMGPGQNDILSSIFCGPPEVSSRIQSY